MGKMKELAIDLANRNHGSWEQQAIDNRLDDEYWEEMYTKEQAYIKGELTLNLNNPIEKQIHRKYERSGDTIEV